MKLQFIWTMLQQSTKPMQHNGSSKSVKTSIKLPDGPSSFPSTSKISLDRQEWRPQKQSIAMSKANC